MTLVQRLRAKVNSTMVPIHLGNGQIINGSGLGSDSASPRLRNEAADKIVEQAARIEELKDVLRQTLMTLDYYTPFLAILPGVQEPDCSKMFQSKINITYVLNNSH